MALAIPSSQATQDDIALEVTQTVDRERPVKLMRLRVRNNGSGSRRLRLYGYAEWVLGNNPQRTRPFVLSSHDEENGVLMARNAFSIDYGTRVAAFAASETPGSFSASRREFIGRHGTIRMPQAVAAGAQLSNSADLDGDPCAALAIDLTLAAGEERDVCFYMADTASNEEALSLIADIRKANFDDVLAASRAFWDGFTGRMQISTPDKAMNNMVNAWLPYQALGCRIMARTAFYQASGAFGFRDQLQDTLAFLMNAPELARKQILNAAARQFHEGDVQHWWLPNSGAGVRTHISDDVVWLAYAIDQYCTVTGDRSLLDEELPFVVGAQLMPGMHDAFFKPEVSTDKVSLYEHAALALDLAISRKGGNGLPLILGGDWNDGMNRVGFQGRGESTWLGWFLAGTLTAFIPYAEARGDKERVERWRTHLPELKKALESAGWDGGYYRRGYFDDGSPLGSHENFECQIDSIAQSWNILSGEGDRERGEKGMNAVLDRLVDDEARIIRLFTPPFAKSARDPGYIKAYPPGVRENGGQYTHAATWVVLALAEMNRGDDAWRCFEHLNPVNHALDRASADHYRVEPYVVAADIYGDGALTGRGGWTWYTGSAGWLYRVAIEGILGIRVANGHLYVKPALPSSWDGFAAELDLPHGKYRISVSKPSDSVGYLVTINDQAIARPEEGFAIGH